MNYSLKIGKKIIPFTYRLFVKDKLIDINNIKKPIFINFWSLSCSYSIDEMININNNVINRYLDNIVFIFINCGDNVNDINEYLNKNKLKMSNIKDFKTNNICIDSNDYITNILNIEEIPTTILVDKDLIIQNIIIGRARTEKYINSIDNLLKTKNINNNNNNSNNNNINSNNNPAIL